MIAQPRFLAVRFESLSLHSVKKQTEKRPITLEMAHLMVMGYLIASAERTTLFAICGKYIELALRKIEGLRSLKAEKFKS